MFLWWFRFAFYPQNTAFSEIKSAWNGAELSRVGRKEVGGEWKSICRSGWLSGPSEVWWVRQNVGMLQIGGVVAHNNLGSVRFTSLLFA